MAVKGYTELISTVNKLLNSEKVMVTTLSSVLAGQKNRIFQKGKDADGSQIGTYSTKPISISRKNQSRNTGKTYFKGGYREYKSLAGKGSGFVNLRNTDQMNFDYGLKVLGRNEYGFGFDNSFNFDKSEWNEEKYKKEIFGHSQEDDATFEKVFQYELDKIQ